MSPGWKPSQWRDLYLGKNLWRVFGTVSRTVMQVSTYGPLLLASVAYLHLALLKKHQALVIWVVGLFK